MTFFSMTMRDLVIVHGPLYVFSAVPRGTPTLFGVGGQRRAGRDWACTDATLTRPTAESVSDPGCPSTGLAAVWFGPVAVATSRNTTPATVATNDLRPPVRRARTRTALEVGNLKRGWLVMVGVPQ